MEEQLVSFKTAMLAKIKGFDWKTLWRYEDNDKSIVGGSLYNHNSEEEQKMWNINLYAAPTQSLLQKWLRDEHDIIVTILIHGSDCYQYTLHNKHRQYVKTVNVGVTFENKKCVHEDTLEKGLFEALQLIT